MCKIFKSTYRRSFTDTGLLSNRSNDKGWEQVHQVHPNSLIQNTKTFCCSRKFSKRKPTTENKKPSE